MRWHFEASPHHCCVGISGFGAQRKGNFGVAKEELSISEVFKPEMQVELLGRMDGWGESVYRKWREAGGRVTPNEWASFDLVRAHAHLPVLENGEGRSCQLSGMSMEMNL